MLKLTIFAFLHIAMPFALPAHAAKVDPVAIIAAHNKLRAEVGVTKKLSYSKTLGKRWTIHNSHRSRGEVFRIAHGIRIFYLKTPCCWVFLPHFPCLGRNLGVRIEPPSSKHQISETK